PVLYPSALHNTALTASPCRDVEFCPDELAFYAVLSDADSTGIQSSHKVKCEAVALRLQRQPGCVLHLPCRRRLGDRKPYRAVDADGAVSVPDRAHLARRLLRLQGAGRSGGGAVAPDLAAAGRRHDLRADPRRPDHDANRPAHG